MDDYPFEKKPASDHDGPVVNSGLPIVPGGNAQESNVKLFLRRIKRVEILVLIALRNLEAGEFLVMDYGRPYWRLYLHFYEVSSAFKEAAEWAMKNDDLKC